MSYNPFQTILDESRLKSGTKLKKGDDELEVVKPVGDDKYLVKEEEVTDESTVIRTQNGRKMVSAEVAIRLAREIAARRKEGEKATTSDLKHATKALTREEAEQIDELRCLLGEIAALQKSTQTQVSEKPLNN